MKLKKFKMNWENISDGLQLIFVVFFTLGVTGYFSSIGVDPHHDGILLKPAIDMLHGKTLFNDTFTQYGALTTIMQAGALHFFGEYLLVIKYLTVVFYGAIAAVTWLFWRRYISSWLSTLSILLWVSLMNFYGNLVFLPWSAVYALLCEMIALYLLVLWVENKKQWIMFLIGALAALAFWFRQPVGIYIFGAVVLFWIVARIKKISLPSLLPLLFGFLFIHVILLAWIIKNNALSAWWLQSISFASSWQSAVATQYRFPFFQIAQLLPLSRSGISIWILLPAVVVYQGYLLVVKKKLVTKEIQLLATVSMCLFSWLQYYPMSDPTHILWAATPMIGFFMYTAWSIPYKHPKKIIVFLLLLCLFIPDSFNRMRDAKKKVQTKYYTFTGETVLKGMRETKINYDYFMNIISAIQTYEKSHPNTFVVSLSPDALYPLFGKNNVNCSRFTIDWRWKIFDKNIEREYTQATMACLNTYQPLVLTDWEHYNPPHYSKLTARPMPPCSSPNDFVGYLLAPSLTAK